MIGDKENLQEELVKVVQSGSNDTKLFTELLERLGNQILEATDLICFLLERLDIDKNIHLLNSIECYLINASEEIRNKIFTVGYTHKNYSVKVFTIILFGQLGRKSKFIFPSLVNSILNKDEDEPVKYNSVRSLTAIGLETDDLNLEVFFSTIFHALKDNSELVKSAARVAIILITKKFRYQTLSYLLKNFSETDKDVLFYTILALKEIALKDGEPELIKYLKIMMSQLIEGIKNPNPWIRAYVVTALGIIGDIPQSALLELKKTIEDQDLRVQQCAKRTLKNMLLKNESGGARRYSNPIK